ncbi:TolC family protein, partial [Sphingomonas sp. 66-10]
MTQSIRTRTAPTALLAAALVGCTTVGPDYRPPETQLSEAWASPVSSEAVDGMWWRRFDDPLLAELVEAAIAGNKDIEEAGARLREARANRDAVYGRELPQAGVSAIATQNRLSENGQLPVGKVPGLGRNLAIYDVGFDASWEIDLWGGTQRAIESSEARAEAAEEARRGVILQVIAEVVRAYIDLRTAQALRSNAVADAKAQAGIARLVSDRLRVGAASRVDYLRAETQARSTAAAVPAYESDEAAAAFRLALLVGQ